MSHPYILVLQIKAFLMSILTLPMMLHVFKAPIQSFNELMSDVSQECCFLKPDCLSQIRAL